jgi:hypothetical protein
MSNITLQQKIFEAIPNGTYPAIIELIEDEEGQYGRQLKFTFRLLTDEKNRTIWGWASATFSNKSKLFSWTKAALCQDIPTARSFNSGELLGKKVTLVIVEVEKDGLTYSKVNSVGPYIEAQQISPTLNQDVWK